MSPPREPTRGDALQPPLTVPRARIENGASSLRPIALPALAPTPLVSVLMPSHNYARFIGAALESVLQQIYEVREVVVCDDGSTDDSVAVVETYASRDSRVRLLRKANGGCISAVNAAYAQSRGDIVCFLDPDDRYLPRKLDPVGPAALRGGTRPANQRASRRCQLPTSTPRAGLLGKPINDDPRLHEPIETLRDQPRARKHACQLVPRHQPTCVDGRCLDDDLLVRVET